MPPPGGRRRARRRSGRVPGIGDTEAVGAEDIDTVALRHRAYLAGKVSEAKICGEMVQVYAGLHERELRDAAERYVSEFVRSNVFPEIASLLAKLHAMNVELWAVSSTNKWVVSAGVRELGIPEERVLAAEVAVTDDIITDTLVDVPTERLPGGIAALSDVAAAPSVANRPELVAVAEGLLDRERKPRHPCGERSDDTVFGRAQEMTDQRLDHRAVERSEADRREVVAFPARRDRDEHGRSLGGCRHIRK